MASAKRSSNAQQKKRGTKSGSAARGRSQRGAGASTFGTAGSDILGVTLVVMAIVMLVSLVTPTSAPVTHALGTALALCFGVGAFLCPLAIILFSTTFFVRREGSIAGRVALGLTLVVVAVLGILSINMPNAEANPDLVLAVGSVEGRGGYLGGIVAWCLISSVGVPVGNVLLLGAIVVGVIVCGFSLSGAVTKLRDRLARGREDREARRAVRAASRQAAPAVEPEPLEAYGGEAPAGMTPLSQRQTTVFRRGRAAVEGQAADNGEEPSEEAPTTLISDARTTVLKRRAKKHPPLDEDESVPAGEVRQAGERGAGSPDDAAPQTTLDPDGKANGVGPAAASQNAGVPDFLVNAAAGNPNKGCAAGAGAKSAKATRRRGERRPARTARVMRPVSPSVGTSANTAGKPSAGVAGAAAPVAQRKPAAAPKGVKRPGDGFDDYELPPFSMLSSNPNSANAASSKEELDQTKERLQGTLVEFGLTSRVVDYVSGPLVTTFRIEMGEGERVSKIKNLEDDIALTLAAEKVRIFAPIRGTSYVGIEIPNSKRSNVHLGDVLPYATGGPLEVAIGRDSAGKPVVADIAKMPHMLVAGTTGSGKSVLINSMVMSLLMRTTPKQVRLIMIDPKRVEFSCYNGLPHLYVPVVTDPRQAASALQWAVSEMERRLKVFERAGARNIKVYNQMCTTGKLSEMDNPPEPMPYIVVVIDELSDLMMTAGKDVEASIVRIAQLARAAGIHLVIATQRPSANVVTGLIKSNIDSRVALKVSSGIDSRVILDETGAERLLGNGDMLFKDRGLAPRRVLGCYTSDDEIESVVSFIRDQAEPDYHNEILSQVVPGQPSSHGGGEVGDDDDPLVWEAAQIVVDSQLGSTSGLQRRLKVGYARAGRIMDMLEAKGVVGPPEGSKPREVLLDKDGLEELKAAEEKYREV